jgi:polar amino acid transport system substrate-binding protein
MKKMLKRLKPKIKQALSMCCACVLVILGSCSSSPKVYTIGVDPSWFPLDAANKEPYILAFSHELLQKIAHLKKCEIQRVAFSWDNLLEAVNRRQCQGILSSLQPHLFNLEKYHFSENFLNTGPVLVMQEEISKYEIEDLSEKAIAVLSQEDEQILAQNYPEVLVRNYDSLQEAFADLSAGTLDGVLIDYLQAVSYVTELYVGKLKIVSPPLNNEGLKLVVRDGDNKSLMNLFNEGLKELKQSGEYAALLKKWKLGY